MNSGPIKPLSYATPPPPKRRDRPLIITLVAVGVLLMVAALMMERPTRRATWINPRVKCASNLRQIGQAMLLYANENNGHFPDHIEALLVEEINPDAFVCPDSNDTPAAFGPTTQASEAALIAGGHLSYIYCGTGLNVECPADMVLVYEPITNHGSTGSNVLFGDGHVEFVQATQLAKIIAELTEGHNPPRPEKLK